MLGMNFFKFIIKNKTNLADNFANIKTVVMIVISRTEQGLGLERCGFCVRHNVTINKHIQSILFHLSQDHSDRCSHVNTSLLVIKRRGPAPIALLTLCYHPLYDWQNYQQQSFLY